MKKAINLIALLFVALLCSCTAKTVKSDLPDWALGEFVRAQNSAILEPDTTLRFNCPMSGVERGWAESDVFNPAAAVKDGKIYVLFRAEDNTSPHLGCRTSRIGLAESNDGIGMIVRSTPVLFPENDAFKDYEWPGGCEDSRVVKSEEGVYVMTYTMWNHKDWILGVATSKDLVSWEKHGPAFEKAHDGRFVKFRCKSGSIVTEVKNGEQVVAKVNGKYLMYWGVETVYAATSDDLIDWQPVLDESGSLRKIMEPRDYYFDSCLTECGPPAIITNKGILLVYNGMNKLDEKRDKNYNAGTYSAGQVLFDLNDPYKVISRLDKPFFYPVTDFEKSGQYVDGTVFVEGLVYFKDKWYLYYGCADSKVGVAICENNICQ